MAHSVFVVDTVARVAASLNKTDRRVYDTAIAGNSRPTRSCLSSQAGTGLRMGRDARIVYKALADPALKRQSAGTGRR